MRIRRLAMVLIAWIMVSTPSIAAACAVCSAGRDEENALAFLLSTIFMSLMPLLAIGTLVFVLWRRLQKLEAQTPERNAPRNRNLTAAPNTPKAMLATDA